MRAIHGDTGHWGNGLDNELHTRQRHFKFKRPTKYKSLTSQYECQQVYQRAFMTLHWVRSSFAETSLRQKS